jgi:putative membrane protein
VFIGLSLFSGWCGQPAAVKVRPKNNLQGAGMTTFLGLGKVLAALFWGVLLANLFDPFAQPFSQLLHVLGGLILLIHGTELLLFKSRLNGCPRPWRERAQVMLFGIFHVLGLPQPQAVLEVPQELEHA